MTLPLRRRGVTLLASPALLALVAFGCATSSQNQTGSSGEATGGGANETEICDNGTDDDGDEKADCEDPDCRKACRPSYEALASGSGFTCGKSGDGDLFCRSWNGGFRAELDADWSRFEARRDMLCAVRGKTEVRCMKPERVIGDDSPAETPTFAELVDRKQHDRAADVPGPVDTFALGSRHACATTNEGALYCWGRGDEGQLGQQGMDDGADQPVMVTDDGSFQDVAVGSGFSCAIDDSGGAHCWGTKALGQLGRGTEEPETRSYEASPAPEPKPVVGDQTFRALSAGEHHVCGVTSEDELYCWGSNRDGQLGTGRPENQGSSKSESRGRRRRNAPPPATEPTLVESDAGWSRVEAGENFTCAVGADDTTRCWGANDVGQLGDGTLEQKFRPVSVAGETAFRELAVGSAHVCAHDGEGATYCWGQPIRERPKQLLATPMSPTDGTSKSGVPRFAEVGPEACYVFESGAVTCPDLGLVNQAGLKLYDRVFDQVDWFKRKVGPSWPEQFGDSSESGAKPLLPFEAADYEGTWHTVCLVGREGDVRCAGDNWYGQLGRGLERKNVRRPVRPKLPSSKSWRDVAVGAFSGCALSEEGDVQCWGTNDRGELGVSTSEVGGAPRPIESDRSFQAISGGYRHTCGLTQEGRVVCWGSNEFGELGRTTDGKWGVPAPVESVENVQQIDVGERMTCAVDDAGDVYCWGVFGQTDRSGTLPDPRREAEQIGLPGDARSVGVLPSVGCAVLDDGRAFCWSPHFESSPKRVRGPTFADMKTGFDTITFSTESGERSVLESAASSSGKHFPRDGFGLEFPDKPPVQEPTATWLAPKPGDDAHSE